MCEKVIGEVGWSYYIRHLRALNRTNEFLSRMRRDDALGIKKLRQEVDDLRFALKSHNVDVLNAAIRIEKEKAS